MTPIDETKMTEQITKQITDQLLNDPNLSNQLRNLLCSDEFIAQKAAERLIKEPEIFWHQLAHKIPEELPMDKIRRLIQLKALIEESIAEMHLNIAASVRNLP